MVFSYDQGIPVMAFSYDRGTPVGAGAERAGGSCAAAGEGRCRAAGPGASSASLTIHKLTCWVCGANLPILEGTI